jgi:ribose transport system ATP-binding protein
VTVLRDGKLVHTGAVAELTRIRLVALMLGREVAEVRERGVTEFGEGHGAIAGEPVIEAKGLERKHVLHDVSLAIRPGEVVGLGGLLGAGRSETAKALAGAQPLDAGEVRVDGRPVRAGSPSAAIRAGIAMIPEDRKVEGIIPHLSVRENIVLAALPRLSRAGIVSDKAQDELVATFMERLRIKASSPRQPVGELSGGNQQKVLLARWLCLSPKVLILDEPTRGIDVGAKAEVQGLIDELAGQGLAVLLISSELEEVLEGSDSIVVLREGAVVDVLEGDDVAEEPLMAALAGGRERADG